MSTTAEKILAILDARRMRGEAAKRDAALRLAVEALTMISEDSKSKLAVNLACISLAGVLIELQKTP